MRKMISIKGLLIMLFILATASFSAAQIGISIRIGPPPLPVYEQPPCPSEGYLWTPGYWAYDYDADDYYWVPGTWVSAPQPGYLWTPPWWGWSGAAFVFHEGYWGPHVGFYGGVVYGFGYTGVGFEGGRWDHDRYYYNRSVTNVNVVNVKNVYNTTVINNTTVNRVSYNGGQGGITARPTREQEQFDRERHVAPVAAQTQHIQEARNNRDLRASVNQGRPAVAATDKPTDFKSNVVAAREAGGDYHPTARPSGKPIAENPRAGNEPNRPDNNRPEATGNERNNNNAEANRPANNVPRPGNNPGAAERNNEPNPSANNNVPRPGNPVHPKDLPAREKAAAPNTGNAKLDQKYQKQQDKVAAREEQQRQKLEQQQDKEHQRAAQQKANDQRMQQMEQKHAQQTAKLQQRQEAQQQKMQQRQGGTAKPAADGGAKPKAEGGEKPR